MDNPRTLGMSHKCSTMNYTSGSSASVHVCARVCAHVCVCVQHWRVGFFLSVHGFQN